MHAYQPDRLANPQGNPVGQWASSFLAYPGLCLGAAASLALMSAVFVNAIWFQDGPHPAPLFETRAAKTAIVRTAATPAAEPASVSRETRKIAKTDPVSRDLLREIQTALSVRGYYGGKLDGVYGSRTRKAIEGFQKDHEIAADGAPTVRLLTQVLMSASSRPGEVPVPNASQIAETPVKVKTVSVKPTVKAEPASLPEGLVARIQHGLKAYGYDDLVVDGRMGQQTATAIQRFQLDYGMKITGQPSENVLEKLTEIGAYRQG